MEEKASVIPAEQSNTTEKVATEKAPVQGAKPTPQPKVVGEKPLAEKPGEDATPKTQAERLLSQEQVNKIVQRRIAAAQMQMLKKYGAKDNTEFEALIDKARKYGDLETQFNQTSEKLKTFENKQFLFQNGVSLQKYDDVVTYMKGKSLELSPTNVQEVLKTHPEWARQVKKPAVGPARIGNTGSVSAPQVSDSELVRNLFPSLIKK